MIWGISLFLWSWAIDVPALVDEQSAHRPAKISSAHPIPKKLAEKRDTMNGHELVRPAQAKPLSVPIQSYELWKTLPRADRKRRRTLYAVPSEDAVWDHDTEFVPNKNPASPHPFRSRRTKNTQKIYYMQEHGSDIDPLVEQVLEQEQQDRKKKKKKKPKKNP